ncbi:hypothetical protein RI367_007107 [Sorochytrium milnesiophthora]
MDTSSAGSSNIGTSSSTAAAAAPAVVVTTHAATTPSVQYGATSSSSTSSSSSSNRGSPHSTGTASSNKHGLCANCRRRRLRCNGELPCRACIKLGLAAECTYEFIPKKRGPDVRYIQALRERVRDLEQELAGNSVTGTMAMDVLSGSSTSPDIEDALHPPLSIHFPSEGDSATAADPLGVLPTPLTTHLLDVFHVHLAVTYTPFFTHDEVVQEFRFGFADPVTLYAVYSLSALFSAHPDIRKHFGTGVECGDYYARKALAIVYRSGWKETLGNVIALLLLFHRAYALQTSIEGWQLNGLVLRMCEQRVHTYYTDELSGPALTPREARIFQQGFLYAWGSNIAASSATARSASLSNGMMALAQAAAVQVYPEVNPPDTRTRRSVPHCILPELPPPDPALHNLVSPRNSFTLFALLSDILQLVNAPNRHAGLCPDRVHELDRRLAHFRQQCPGVAVTFVAGMELSFRTLTAVLLYNTAIITLHRHGALHAAIDGSLDSSYAAAQSLAAAERILVVARYIQRHPLSIPHTTIAYTLLMAASVYIHRSIAAPLPAADIAKLYILLDAMEKNIAVFDLVDLFSQYLRGFLNGVQTNSPSDAVVLAARFPRRFARSDAGCVATLKYQVLLNRTKASESGGTPPGTTATAPRIAPAH